MAGMLLAFALASCTQQPQSLSIIPVPLKAELQGGAFVVNEKTQVWIDAPEADKNILQEYLASSPLKLAVAAEAPASNAIVLKQVEELPGVESAEG